MVFIVREKAYDGVSKKILWRCLEASRVSVAYIKSIQDMYDDAKIRVKTLGGDSEHFSILIGLHQRSTLSPFLFALVTDALTWHIQGGVLWCILFADDVETDVVVKLDSQAIQKKESFKYLGSIIQGDGKIDKNFTHSIGAGWLKWRLDTGVLRDKKVAKMMMLRWLCGQIRKDRVRNETIPENVGLVLVEDKMQKVRLYWFRHMMRRGADAPVWRCETLATDDFR
ncbi:uncharacterized protein LOC124890643 [Capsicum annuum]|uniref:uncharacterized protein LOC124890643 n=1 Tax=Capsicum annuum TaxID=4072 RepID=UPI0007BF25FC|nr:uncharacterized protein LOC124890643 [Capsicum annuum]